MSKFELSFDLEYVPSWNSVRALKEFLQNGLDAETEDAENKFTLKYNNEQSVLYFHNAKSVLTARQLLIGSSTKRGSDLRGAHGEGFKLAILILLREGKTVEFYHAEYEKYWKCRIVQSVRYKAPIVVVEEVKMRTDRYPQGIVPNGLTVKVTGIPQDVYDAFLSEFLLGRYPNGYDVLLSSEKYGEVLVGESEVGKIYVGGIFVKEEYGLNFGYNFAPSQALLDRDRSLMDNFDLKRLVACIWLDGGYLKNGEVSEVLLQACADDISDLDYFNRSDAWFSMSRKEKNYFGEVLAEYIQERELERHKKAQGSSNDLEEEDEEYYVDGIDSDSDSDSDIEVKFVSRLSNVPLEAVVKSNPTAIIKQVSDSVYSTLPESAKATVADGVMSPLRRDILDWLNNLVWDVASSDKAKLELIIKKYE